MNERPGAGPVGDGPGDGLAGGWPAGDRPMEEGSRGETSSQVRSASEGSTDEGPARIGRRLPAPDGERSAGEGSAREDPRPTAAAGDGAPSDESLGRCPDASRAGSGGSEEPGDDWRRSTLEDFRQWLEGQANPPPADVEPPDAEPPDECDLHTLFSELAALRQEIRLQNREQSRAGRALASAAAGYDAARLAGERRDEDLADLERRVARASEDRVLRSVLEVRDALVRGRAAARELGDRPRLAWISSRRIAGVAEGYEQALRRFDRVLAGFGVRIVPALGEPFDSRTMHAVAARPGEGAGDKVVVVEEIRSGFTREGEVLRLADVAVSRDDSRK